jgi:Holliday junction resolvasome RuvABC endonuclease subunit
VKRGSLWEQLAELTGRKPVREELEPAAEPPEQRMDANEPVVIGVDPGFSGALAVLTLSGEVVLVAAMPVTKVAKGSELDTQTLIGLIDGVRKTHPIRLATIEKVHAMPKQGVTSVFTFGKAYGEILGVLKTLGVPVELVTPQRWQKEILHGTAGKSKEDSIAFARRRFPHTSLKATARSTKDHDGISDALAIAEWGRRQIAGK